MKMTEDKVAGRRTDGLHDIVLADVGTGKKAQKGHRDHGGGNRGGDGEADLQSQIHIGGGEKKGERHAQRDAAPGEFLVVWSHARDWIAHPGIARPDFARNPGLGQFHEALLARIGTEPHPLIERQGAGMVQGAGIDQQLGDRLGPGADAGLVEEEIAQPFARAPRASGRNRRYWRCRRRGNPAPPCRREYPSVYRT